MRYYPVFLDLRRRCCLVVGGGRVAERKVLTLLRAGAKVRVVSPRVMPRLAELAQAGKIELVRRAYRPQDLAAPAPKKQAHTVPLLVFAATDNPVVQQAVQHDAAARGALVNAANAAEESDFLVPASFAQGDLQVAISTSGGSPALARRLRLILQRTLGSEYRDYLRELRAARLQLKRTVNNQNTRAKNLRRLVKHFGV